MLLLPLTSLTDVGRLAPFEALVVRGLASVPGITVVPPADLLRALKKAHRPGPEACEGNDACLAEMGRLVDASRVVACEMSGLGSGQVAYVKAIDVATGKETASTTAVFGEGQAAREAEARAAAFRLLAPGAYVGTLGVTVDVPKAAVYVDGVSMGRSPMPPLRVGVGTHALRVTHPEYRDWVRFVDVEFDRTTSVAAGLKAYPVVAEAMRQRQEQPPGAPAMPLPWYRRTWAVAGFGAAVLVVTAVVVGLAVDTVERDREVTVR